MKRFLGAIFFTSVVVACGGASATDIFDTSANDTNAGIDSGSASGIVDAGSTGKTDSGSIGVGGDAGGFDSGSVDSGGSVGPTKCTIDGTGASVGCKSNEYCVSNDCATGTCSPIPTAAPDNSYDAQCGCDNVNYWNAEVAHNYGQSVKSSGTCTTAIACNVGKCTGGTYGCELQQNTCTVALPGGSQCWGVPPTCPEGNGATLVRECAGGSPAAKCSSQCDAFTSKTPYILSANCN